MTRWIRFFRNNIEIKRFIYCRFEWMGYYKSSHVFWQRESKNRPSNHLITRWYVKAEEKKLRWNNSTPEKITLSGIYGRLMIIFLLANRKAAGISNKVSLKGPIKCIKLFQKFFSTFNRKYYSKSDRKMKLLGRFFSATFTKHFHFRPKPCSKSWRKVENYLRSSNSLFHLVFIHKVFEINDQVDSRWRYSNSSILFRRQTKIKLEEENLARKKILAPSAIVMYFPRRFFVAGEGV